MGSERADETQSIEPSVAGATAGLSAARTEGERYRRGDEIARGGVGAVVAGVDRRLGRDVAIKELLAPAPVARARFQREARITARLEHPGVVPIYDQGWSGDGEPFYVMRRVDGRTLSEEVAARPSVSARLALVPTVLAVADTIAYAHGRRIIHRDLKPSNVLCGAHGSVLVIDWGLAKELGTDDDDAPPAAGDAGAEPTLTSMGAIMGTPAYMAPEQARGEAADERSDVYALGGILYHVLAGRAPGAERPAVTGAPRELLAVLERAMHREPAARYASAAAFADDLRAFQGGGLVSTYRYGTAERARRWMRRHRAAVAVAAVLTAALAVTAVVSVRRITRERDRARAALAALEQRDTERALRFAEDALGRDPTGALGWVRQARPAPADAWLARSLAEAAVARGAARHTWQLDGRGQLLVGDGARVLATDTAGSVWLWDGTSLRRLARGHRGARPLAVDATRALFGDEAGGVYVAALPGGAVAELGRGAWVRGGALAPDGSLWWVDVDGVVRRAAGGAVTEIARTSGGAADLAVHGARWAVSLENGTVITAAPGEPERRVQRHDREVSLRFAGDTLISTGEDGLVLAWAPGAAEPRELGRHDGWIASTALSPDGRTLATGSGDRRIALWPLDGGAPRWLAGHGGTVVALAWSERGLVSGDDAGGMRRWQLDDGAVASWRPGDGGVRRAVWRDDELVALVGNTLRVWTELPPPQRRLAAPDDAAHLAAAGPLVAAAASDRVRAWRDGALVLDAALTAAPVAIALRGDRLWVMTERAAWRWTVGAAPAPDAALVTGSGTSGPRALPGGDEVAWHDDAAGGVTLLHRDGTRVALRLPVSPQAFAVTADRRAVVTGDRDGTIALAPLDGSPRRVYGRIDRAGHVALTPDQRWVVAEARSGALWVVPRDGSRPLASLLADATGPFAVLDGAVVAAADRTVVVAPLDGGPARRLDGHRARVVAVDASPDGALAASLDAGGEVRIWRLRDGAAVVVPVEGRARDLRFAAADQLAVLTANAVVLVPGTGFHDRSGPLAAWLDARSSAALDAALVPRSPAAPPPPPR